MENPNHDHNRSHNHSHGHAHEHTHEAVHDHTHEHGHAHGHMHTADTAAGKDKTLILLQYTVDHNAHHADELDSLIKAMRADGRDEAAVLTEQAQDAFRRGSELLREALAACTG